MADIIIFWLGRADYLGCVDGQWYAWPAERDGWTRRREATSSAAADAVELPQDLARLALRLSGVRVEDVG